MEGDRERPGGVVGGGENYRYCEIAREMAQGGVAVGEEVGVGKDEGVLEVDFFGGGVRERGGRAPGRAPVRADRDVRFYEVGWVLWEDCREFLECENVG